MLVGHLFWKRGKHFCLLQAIPIISQTRYLEKKGELQEMSKGGTLFNMRAKFTPIYLFLFNDLLIIAAKKGWGRTNWNSTLIRNQHIRNRAVCLHIHCSLSTLQHMKVFPWDFHLLVNNREMPKRCHVVGCPANTANSQTNEAMSGLVRLNNDLMWQFDLIVVNTKYFTFLSFSKRSTERDRGKVKGHWLITSIELVNIPFLSLLEKGAKIVLWQKFWLTFMVAKNYTCT